MSTSPLRDGIFKALRGIDESIEACGGKLTQEAVSELGLLVDLLDLLTHPPPQHLNELEYSDVEGWISSGGMPHQ